MIVQIPPEALEALAEIPPYFVDDGCSAAPDLIFGVDLWWACRIHDYHWCTRANPEGSMTPEWKLMSNGILRAYVREALLGHRLRFFIAAMFFTATKVFGGAFNTCGLDAGYRCRHRMVAPDWMLKGGTK